MTLTLRLLALVAVLLLPFGMAAAPAEVHQQHPASQASGAHCPDEDTNRDATGAQTDCTMACASALPASEGPPVESQSFARSPAEPELARSLAGLILEIATPPPKLS